MYTGCFVARLDRDATCTGCRIGRVNAGVVLQGNGNAINAGSQFHVYGNGNAIGSTCDRVVIRGNGNVVHANGCLVVGNGNKIHGRDCEVCGEGNDYSRVRRHSSSFSSSSSSPDATDNGIPQPRNQEATSSVAGTITTTTTSISGIAYPDATGPHAEPSAPAGTPDERLCYVCLDRAANTVAVPCGHPNGCVTCVRAGKPTVCGVCRQPVTQILRVYL